MTDAPANALTIPTIDALGADESFRYAAKVAIEVDGKWHEVSGVNNAPLTPSDTFTGAWQDGDNTHTCRVKRSDGQPFKPAQVCVEVTMPLLDFASVVVPDCGRHYVFNDKSLHIRAAEYRICASNAGHPFFALNDEMGRFMLGFGIVSATGEVSVRRILPVISGRKAMVGGDNVLVLRMFYRGPAEAQRELPIELMACTDEPTWHHALRRFTGRVIERDNIKYPNHPDAWQPTWCTWTSFPSADLTPQRVLDNAKVARDLGIGAIILDDGWFGAGLDDDANEPLNLGVYEPDPTKLPELAKCVADAQKIGVKVLLWHAPLCVAPDSPIYDRMKKYYMIQHGEEFRSPNGLAQLCCACPEVRQYVVDETKRLFREYGVDGLKVDLYNCLPDSACENHAHEHDIEDPVHAVAECMRVQWEAMKEANPDVLLELKQDYGNVRFARFGTMVRAGDTAFDIDTNIRRCFYTQAASPVVHNDYLATSTLTRPDALGMLVLKMLIAGVPTFGIELTALSDTQRDVIRHWLSLYHEHLPMFQQPRRPQRNDMSVWEGGDVAQAWVAALWHAETIRLPEAQRVLVFNATGRDRLRIENGQGQRVQLTARDHQGKTVDEQSITLAANAELPVPPAGMLELVTEQAAVT